MSCNAWFFAHPWMTLFLGFVALNTIRIVVRGWPKNPKAWIDINGK